MDVVLVILVLAIFIVILILRNISKQDDNEPPCPDAQYPDIPPDAQYPDLQLMSGRRIKEPEQDSHTKTPPIPDKIPFPFDYDAPWWRDYSRWIRAEKNWQCDECGISLKYNHEMLHTHHTYRQNVNSPEHLQALCIGCHAEQPGKRHRQIKKSRTYKRFMERYGEQWRSLCEEMGFES